MTVEEQLQQLQEQHEKAQKEIETLKKNQSEQNAYITKLEKEKADALNEAEKLAKATQSKGSTSNSAYENYMRNKWRTEVVDNALESLKKDYPANHVELLRDDIVEYCKKNMTDQTTTEKYAKKVFAMLYGEALGDKNHAIHKLDQDPDPKPEDKPDPTKKKEPSSLSDALTPHTMTKGDTEAGQGNVPPAGKEGPKSTRDSFNALKERLASVNNTDS